MLERRGGLVREAGACEEGCGQEWEAAIDREPSADFLRPTADLRK